MANGFKLLVLPRAETDIDSIFNWLSGRSLLGAKNWVLALKLAFDRISKDADSLALAPESRLVNEQIRQCLFKTPKGRTYRILCLVEREGVIVLRVRGPGQPSLSADELGNG